MHVLHLYVCVGLMPLHTGTGVAPLTMASCLLPVASSGEQLSDLTGVCACHWPTSRREKGREREREAGGGGRFAEREEVWQRLSTHVYICVFVCLCECTVAMSHTVWGLQCICAQHDKCVPLDSISSLQPHSIWCQLCTLWYRACSVLQGDEWDVWNSAMGLFYWYRFVTCALESGSSIRSSSTTNLLSEWLTQRGEQDLLFNGKWAGVTL